MPKGHDSGTHAPLLQVSPQAQTGLQVFDGHMGLTGVTALRAAAGERFTMRAA